jgi:ribosomal protein S8
LNLYIEPCVSKHQPDIWLKYQTNEERNVKHCQKIHTRVSKHQLDIWLKYQTNEERNVKHCQKIHTLKTIIYFSFPQPLAHVVLP